MAFVCVNQAEDRILNTIVNKSADLGLNLILKLFKSNTTPAEGDTEASYTEADFPGYAQIELTGASWTVSNPTASYAKQTFTCSGGGASQDIYGAMLVQKTSGKLMFVERFSSVPKAVVANGDKVEVTPSITCD